MANRASTSSVVRLNQKIENTEVYSLPAPADGTVIAEGRFIAYDATAKAGRLGAATDLVVFLNWVESTRPDVLDTQTAPMANLDHANAGINIGTGGLAGIVGQGTIIGLPTSLVAGTPAVGELITCAASGVVTAKTVAALGGAAAEAADTRVFGTIFRVESNVVWFIFNSAATLYDMAGT